MPADLHKVRPHQPLNRNLDHNWQQALLKTSSERRIAVDVTLSGWHAQAGSHHMTCEDGVSVTHTLDGEFAEANQAEKKRWPTCVTVSQNWGKPSLCARVQVNLPPLFVPSTACSTSCVGKLRRCWMKRALNAWQRGHPQAGLRTAAGLP